MGGVEGKVPSVNVQAAEKFQGETVGNGWGRVREYFPLVETRG
jgi:hypothetical protein